MNKVNIHEAKTHLSRLVDRAAGGEEIIIAKSGKPVARLVAYTSRKEPRRPGYLRVKIRVKRNFDQPLPKEILASFEDRS